MTSIRTRFLLAVAIFAVVLSAFIFVRTWIATREQAEQLTRAQAELAHQFDLAIRRYVGEEIRPWTEQRVGQDEFDPRVMSTSFVSRRVFEDVRQHFKDYIIKFSSDHPRNPANAAGPEELRILQYFREHPEAKTWVGSLTISGKEYLVRCSPRRMDRACLRCHGRPEDAPASLLKQYGADAGFHQALGSVMALDTIGIPLAEIRTQAAAEATAQLIALAVLGLLMFGALVLVFRTLIGRRLAAITAHFKHAADQPEDAPIRPVAVTGDDEIGILEHSFNALVARIQRLHASLEQRVSERTASLEAEIVERKQAQAELARTRDAAEAANRAKSEFLANMSHEIRTPMTAILGYIDVLAECCQKRCLMAQTEIDNPIAVISQNARHLLQIIDDVLDLSKIEAGKIAVERMNCSPRELITDVASLMHARAAAKGLKLNVCVEGSLPENIQSDPTRLRQILLNIVGNAVKFTEQGEIRLAASLDRTDPAAPMLQIEVTDTGIGMSAEMLERLFSPFTQADNSTSRKYGGTGLGLTISRRLAELLGGHITVKSSPGRGSRFTLRVPTGPLESVHLQESSPKVVLEPQVPTPEQSEPKKASLEGCLILLAEDGPDNQRLIAFLLKKAGAEVAVAANGRVAVDLALASEAEGHPFNVILMDMQMPVMDGYEAVRTLRTHGWQGPILALTAHAMAEDRQKCLDAGCDDYLAKPVEREKLVETVGTYYASKATADGCDATP